MSVEQGNLSSICIFSTLHEIIWYGESSLLTTVEWHNGSFIHRLETTIDYHLPRSVLFNFFSLYVALLLSSIL